MFIAFVADRRLLRRLLLVSLASLLGLTTIVTPARSEPPPSPTAEPQVNSREGETVEPPEMKNWTWLVADADSGAVLAGRDWRWQLPPASTLKALTALAMVKRLELDSHYRVQQAETEVDGSKVGVKAGSRYTVRDLLNGMLMPSGNDAALAIANAYGGMDRATAAMKEELARLGATDTVPINTSGLDEPGQVSTAYDLALVMRDSLKNETLAEIYKQHDVQFPDEEPTDPAQERKSYTIWTENRLVLNYYPGALGGKTGFTSQAGRTYVGAAERDGRRFIVVIMRSAESTEKAVHRVLDWAFENADKVEPVDQLVEPQPDSGDITPQQAVSYDEGVSNLDAVRTDASQGAGGLNPLLLLAILSGIGAVIILLRRRHQPNAPTRRDVDLRDRERENSPLG